MNWFSRYLVIGLALWVAACAASPFGPSPKKQLGNLTVYATPVGRPIKLVDGRYRDPAGQVQARLLHVTAGELGGDSGRDAVGVLELTVSGKGVHYQLLAAVEQRGKPLASSIYLGDRLKPETLRMAGSAQLQLQLKRGQSGDLTCCPSLTLTELYRWQGDKLQEVAPPLVATRWEVIELWGRPVKVEEAVQPHLTFGPDQSAQAFGGCNELAVGYQLKGPTLRLDGVGGGTEYCADTPEEDFIGALIQIDRYLQQGPILELHSGNEVLARLRAAP